MAVTNVELYESLKGPVGEEAARLIAEVVPSAANLATKEDIAATKADIAEVKADVASVQVEVARLETRLVGHINGRLWAMFVPLWLGLYGAIGTMIWAVLRQG